MSQTHSTKQQYCLEVAPLTSIPVTRSPFFTYLSDKPVPKGSIVSVPLFMRTLKGMVFDVYPYTERAIASQRIKLKPIYSLMEESVLTAEQLALAKFLSQEYLTSLGRCLVHFTPQPVKARKNIESDSNGVPVKKITLTPEQKTAIDILSEPSIQPSYLFGPASSGKTEVYMRSMKKRIGTTGQALILVPELSLIPQEKRRYEAFFGAEHVVTLHSHLSPGELFKNWEKIRSGEARVIVGTRQALFAPYKKLEMIAVDEEQDDAYKQWDMSPRYDARTVARKLAELHQANLTYGSATPSVELFHAARTGTFRLATLPPLPQQPPYTIEVANLRFEYKNKSLLSSSLLMELTFALKHGHQALLFVNRQGMSAFSVCEQCKHVLRCPSCDRALVYDTQLGSYRCLHCTHTGGAFSSCPKCGGLAFKNLGIGTQKVEREIHKHFPGARILRMDQQSMKKSDSREKAYQQFASGKADILIGTQMSSQGWDLPNVTLVSIIDADSLFAFPDFKTDEKAFQHILQSVGRMARIGGTVPGKAIIQTFHPENPIFESIVAKDISGFTDRILGQRQDLGYPPYGRLAKLVFQHTDAQKVEKEAAKAHKLLKEAIKNTEGVRVPPPFDPILSKVRGKYRKHIIIRFPEGPLPEAIRTPLKKLAGSWSLDIDPVNLV